MTETFNLQATLTRTAFNEACAALAQEDADRIVRAFPDVFRAHVFRAHVTFAPATMTLDATPALGSPGPAKTREPKAEAQIDKEALTATITKALALTPRLRAEDYAAALNSADFGTRDAKVFGAAVKKALEGLVSSKAAYCEGDRRARRYWLAAKAEPEAAE